MKTAGTPINLHRGLAVTAALVLALGTAACGGDDEGGAAEPAASSGAQGAGSSTTPQPAPTAGDSPAPAPAPAKPIASKEGSFDDDAVTLDILELKRSGNTVVLNFQLRATNPDADGSGTGTSAQISTTFGNNINERTPGGEPVDDFNLDGITLIDTKNRKRHLVGRDSENQCVCTNNLSATFVKDAGPVSLTATYGPPPADVQAMDVSIPSYGTFTDVPLS